MANGGAPAGPASAVQGFVGEVMSTVTAPVDALNLGLAKATLGLLQVLPKMPAARLYTDLVFQFGHSHPHPPTFGFPIPSLGPILASGCMSVLINGLPAARNGDMGLAVWCGGYFPIFEVITGSSHVFMGGSRSARQCMDMTLHCLPDPFGGKWGIGKLDIAMAVFGVGMSALNLAASAEQAAAANAKAGAAQITASENASDDQAAAEAEMAAAAAAAAGVGAATAAAQLAADAAAIAMGLLMGKDPGVGFPLGMIVMGSPNVLVGGFPMPGWMMVLRGLGKLLRPLIRRVQLKLPPGRLRRALCAATGHPVEVASGRMFTGQTDLEIDGRIPIIFERNYDTSAIDYEGPLGAGWIHPYDQHIWDSRRHNCLIWRDRENRQVRFDRLEIGQKMFQPLERVWLERTGPASFAMRDLKDGLLYKYGSVDPADPDFVSEARALRLLEISDRNGNTVVLRYNGPQLSEISNASGTYLSLEYRTFTSRTRLAEIRQHLRNGQSISLVKYDYDEDGDLIAAVDRTYVPFKYFYRSHLMVRETNRNGLSFHFEYDSEGRDARCTHTYGDGGIYERTIVYSPKARITRVTDSLGGETVYHYNELDLITKIFDAEGGICQWKYGAFGEEIEATDEMGRTTTYHCDPELNLIATEAPDGGVRRVEYNELSLPGVIQDESGASWVQEYDERGNILSTVNPNGAKRSYEYNDRGDVISFQDGVGNITRFTWSTAGQLETVTTPRGRKLAYSYNHFNLPAEITDASVGTGHQFQYDDAFRIRRVAEVDAKGKTLAVQRYEYDPQGNVVKYTDSRGNHTSYNYTGRDQLSEHIDALGFARRFSFDTEERLTQITNENGDVFRMTYDLVGNVIEEIGFDGSKRSYEYNHAGELIRQEDPLRREIFYRYDLNGRVTGRIRSDGTTVSYEYDVCGRVVSAVNKDSQVKFEYDPAWQIVSETQNERNVYYEYDAELRRTRRVVSVDGSVASDVRYDHDSDGNLARVDVNGQSISYERDLAGRLTDKRLPNGIHERQEYGDDGRLARQVVSTGMKDKPIVSRHFRWDPDGDLISISDSLRGERKYARDPMERLARIEYTSPGQGPSRKQPSGQDRSRNLPPVEKRLWQADFSVHEEGHGSVAVEQMSYDGDGNLLRRTQGPNRAIDFEYSRGDRLQRRNGVDRIFDDAGNLIRRRLASGHEVSYSYDSDNQLVSVSTMDSRVEFKYDPFGRRITKIGPGGRTTYIWDGDVLAAEYRDETNQIGYVNDGFVPLAQIREDGLAFYHPDHLGMPKEITGHHGALIWQGTFDEFGTLTSATGEQNQNIRFQGQYEDPETGLYYNRYRYYDPEDSRYLNKDPIGLLGGLNFYAYVHDPTQYVDPLGLVWQPGTPKPKGWRLPKNGTWSGEKGHSNFTPRNPKALGLNPGDSIPFKNGMPDFSQWSQRNMRVAGMTGVHDTDMPLIHAHLARQMGLPNQTAAKNWLSQQGLTPHHAGGSKVILVPTALHDGVRHMGGAQELRKNNKKNKTC